MATAKRQADGHADHGHGFGAVLLAGQVRKQCHDGGGNRAGALQDASGDHAPDRIGLSCQYAANGKDDQGQDKSPDAGRCDRK
jgi:hypothetical protein